MSGMSDSQRYPLNLFISNIEEDVVNFLQYKSKNHFMRDSTIENNPFSARKLSSVISTLTTKIVY